MNSVWLIPVYKFSFQIAHFEPVWGMRQSSSRLPQNPTTPLPHETPTPPEDKTLKSGVPCVASPCEKGVLAKPATVPITGEKIIPKGIVGPPSQRKGREKSIMFFSRSI